MNKKGMSSNFFMCIYFLVKLVAMLRDLRLVESFDRLSIRDS
jgi:hypothetical protein